MPTKNTEWFRKNSRSRRPTNNAMMDMTPLVDVVFLLLIFFMITTSFDAFTQLEVDLPQADGSSTSENKAEVLTIRADGSFWLGTQEISLADLDQSSLDGKFVEIVADAEVRHTSVVKAMEFLQKAQAKGVTIRARKY
jgi:biopolymer transport protein ExbD